MDLVGEQVLRDTKQIREQNQRLHEIDQRLQSISRSQIEQVLSTACGSVTLT